MFTSKNPAIMRFQTYMDKERNCSSRTATEYARDIDRFWRFNKSKPLAKVKTKRIRTFLASLQDTNQPQSVTRKIAALAAFYKFAKREKWCKSNPVDEIEKPKAGKRLPNVMTEHEVRCVLAAAGTIEHKDPMLAVRDRAMMELLYGSGLRRSEVVSIDVGDMDLDARTLRVIGKGDKQRMVFLSQPTIDAIRAYLTVRHGNTGALFVTVRGTRLSARQAWVVFRGIADKAGMQKAVPHTMRHSFATHMLEHGADIMTIKELLGHSSVATTQLYTNVSMEHMRGTFERTHPSEIGQSPRARVA